jgi:hypothetical protein
VVAGITAYADGPDEMREVIRHHIDLGVDQIKLSMSGEEVIFPLFYDLKIPLANRQLISRSPRFEAHKTVISQTKKQQLVSMKPQTRPQTLRTRPSARFCEDVCETRRGCHLPRVVYRR